MNKSSLAEWLKECSEAEALTRIKAMPEPLSTRLATYVEWLASSSPDFALAYHAFVERLSTAEFASRGPQVGDMFPSFLLPDQNGQLISLEKLLSERPLVLSFNRGHWCGLCQIELDALNRAAPEIKAAGGSLVAIIPEPQIMSRKLLAENNLDLVVLSELLYYFGDRDLRAVLDRAAGSLEAGGTLLAVHWRHPVADYPRSGDDVHRVLAAQPGLAQLVCHEEPDFLAEVWVRTEGRPVSVAQSTGLA